MVRNIDSRVLLDFVYIPKNAYESRTFFRLISRCGDWITIPEIDAQLKIQDHKNKTFWDNQEKYKTKTRKSSKSTRGSLEVIRDIFDMAAYMGLLDKRFEFFEGRKVAIYRLTQIGYDICGSIVNPDDSINEEQNAVNKLTGQLLSYGITNTKVNMDDYTKFTEYSARPFFLLLKLLYEFKRKYPEVNLKVHPAELTYLVLSLKNEEEDTFIGCIDRLYQFARQGVFHKPKVDNKQDFTTLNEFLNEIGYTYDDFIKRENNMITRLTRWSYFTDLVDADTTDDSIYGFYNLIDSDVRVLTIRGLSELGIQWYKSLEETRYYSTAYSFNASEVLISKLVSHLGVELNQDTFKKYLLTKGICNKKNIEGNIHRLNQLGIIEIDNGRIIPKIEPYFSWGHLAGLEERIAETVNDYQTIENIPQERYRINEDLLIQSPYSVSKEFLEFLENYHILTKEQREKYNMSGIDPYFYDYEALSVRKTELMSQHGGIYTDIAEAFEKKTSILFEQMGFERVEHLGQNIARGSSYPDVVAIWNRRVNGEQRHLTIIECKSNQTSNFSINPSDIDSTVRQISNLKMKKEYQLLSDKIDSILYVSSGFGGNYRNKLMGMNQKARDNARVVVRSGCITAETLLYLYSRVRRDPIKFGSYNFINLFNEDLVVDRDIERIFSVS